MANRDLNIVLGIDTKQLDKSLGKLQRKLNSFAFKAQNIGSTLTQSLTLPIIGVGAAAVKSFADFDKMRKGLEAVAGGAAAAEKQMERLRVLALNPGISLDQAVKGTLRLQAVGLQAKEAEATLLQLSKAVTLTGGSAIELEAVTRQFTQMISKNRILAEDFQVVQDNIPAIGFALQDAFGTQNIEAIRETGISAKDFVAQLTAAISQNEKFQNVQGGLANSFDNFRQAITASLVELGDSINKSLDLQKVLTNLSDRVQNAVNRFKNLDDRTKSLIVRFGVITAALGPAIFAIGKIVQTGAAFVSFARLLLPALAALTSPIGLIIAGVTALAAGFAILYKRNEKFRVGVNKVAKVIKTYVISAFQVLRQVVLILIEGWKSKIKVLRAVFSAFTSVGKAVLDTAKKVPILKKGIELTGKAFKLVANTIRNSFVVLPAFFAGIGAEAESLGANIIAFFQKLGLNADILALKIKKGLTIDSSVRESLQREIEALQQQKAAIENTGEEFGVAFKRAFNEALKGLASSGGGVSGSSSGVRFSATNNDISPTVNSSGGGGSGNFFDSLPEITDTTDQLEANFQGVRDIINDVEASRGKLTVGFNEYTKVIRTTSEASEAMREKINLQIQAQEELAKRLENQKILGEGLQTIMSGLGTAIGDTFSGVIDGTKKGASAFRAFAKTAISAIANIVGALVKQAIAAAIANTALKGGPLGVALAAGAGILISNAIKAAFANAPGLAQGGIVPPGFPNDTYPAFLSSGETVVPPGKLPNMVGGSGYIAETRLDGRDLLIAIRRTEKHLGRIE